MPKTDNFLFCSCVFIYYLSFEFLLSILVQEAFSYEQPVLIWKVTYSP